MSERFAIHARSWFDGRVLHDEPVSLLAHAGRIAHLVAGPLRPERWPLAWQAADVPLHLCPFLMPGLCDAHVHLFLDGDEDDLAARQAHLKAGRDQLLACGRRNLERHLGAGITLLRDCGDRHGINHELRATCAADRQRAWPRILSAGLGIRAPGRYGSFFAEEWADETPAAAVGERCDGADLVKIVLSGIIDFAAAQVKGRPQFDAPVLQRIAAGARLAGLPSTAHCSGAEAIELAIGAGLDGIEHGFFMTSEQLQRYAAAGGSWTPTWAPVDVMRRRPEMLGLEADSIAGIDRILDAHRQRMAAALQAGLCVLPGTDAGSPGVPHGRSLVEELRALAVAGWPTAAILRSVTSEPRRRWQLAGGRLAVGERLDCAGFRCPPSADFIGWEQAVLVCAGGRPLAAQPGSMLAAAS